MVIIKEWQLGNGPFKMMGGGGGGITQFTCIATERTRKCKFLRYPVSIPRRQPPFPDRRSNKGTPPRPHTRPPGPTRCPAGRSSPLRSRRHRRDGRRGCGRSRNSHLRNACAKEVTRKPGWIMDMFSEGLGNLL